VRSESDTVLLAKLDNLCHRELVSGMASTRDVGGRDALDKSLLPPISECFRLFPYICIDIYAFQHSSAMK
jgi:hypothetical protein